MVESEMMKLLTVIAQLYPKFEVNDIKAQVFYELLGDLDYNILQTAIKKHMLTSEYPPTIAELRKLAVEIKNPSLQLTAADAWGEVEKAIHNYGSWGEIEALNSMSERTRKVVEYMGWQSICRSENIEVTRGQFIKMYEQVSERNKTQALLPEALNTKIKELSHGNMKMLEGGE